MVRTYAYNPSTQSAGLPGSRKPPPELANNNAPRRVPVAEQRQIQYNGDQMPFMHQVFPPEEPRNLDASLSSGSSLGSASSSQYVTGNTQLFGIRSVLINGQQFYQPLDSHFNMLINKEFAKLGILNDAAPRNNNEMPPNDPTPVNYRPQMQLMGQPQLLGYQPAGQIYPGFPIASAVFHASTGNLAYQNVAKPQQSQDALRRSDSMKAFSEFEPAIQRNQVGVPMNTLNPMDSYASSSVPPQVGYSVFLLNV
uniref:Ovule protein n=1 Tax=Panagrellus redivivus TaxID=6233 RepID=A0A7E4W1N6_PANRE